MFLTLATAIAAQIDEMLRDQGLALRSRFRARRHFRQPEVPD